MRWLLVAGVVVALAALGGCGASAPSAPPGPPLVGTEWRVVSVGGRVPVAGHEITLRLEPSGRLGGSTGCNSYGADFRVEDGRLVVAQVGSTAAMCVDEVANELEREFLSVLASGPLVGLGPDGLRLRSEAGEVALVAQ